MTLFDSHCHLQDARCIGDIDAILARAGAAGVAHMLCCGTSESDWQAVASLARNHPQIVPAFGLHPLFIDKRSPDWLEKLERMLRLFPSASVGEIGLDHAVGERNDAVQTDIFLAQLKLARTLARPVSIHCRKAWGDMLRILSARCGLPHGGAIHSFSGPPDLIPQLTGLKVSLSFSGSIVYDRNRRGRACAAAVDERCLLIETDSPDIPPPGIKQGENEPARVREVARALSEVRGCALDRIAERTSGNALRLFTINN
jgi:TatD DNase family protein